MELVEAGGDLDREEVGRSGDAGSGEEGRGEQAAMTRRAFITAFCVTMTANRVTAEHGPVNYHGHENGTTEGFILRGLLQNAGQESERYWSIGQSVGLMLDPAKHPAMVAGADALLGSEVELRLMRAV